MYISLDFYNDFHCSGGNCHCTCCAAGWGIDVDDKTYQKYQNIRGRFGQFVRRNLYDKDGIHYIRLNENLSCPFLNEEGLCQLVLRIGEESLSKTCACFPRRFLDLENLRLCALSLSCEEVSRIIYDRQTPVSLYMENDSEAASEEEKALFSLCGFLNRGMDFLQDTSIPFGRALATLIYIGMENQNILSQIPRLTEIDKVLAQIPDVLNEFTSAAQSMTKEFEQAAWQFIFTVTDTFCQVLEEGQFPYREQFLWADTFYQLPDRERKEKLYNSWKNRKKDPHHLAFMRALAATLLFADGIALTTENPEHIFLRKIATFIILAEVLPPVWNPKYQTERKYYFSGLAHICRKFDQSPVVNNFIYPVICDLMQPDVLTYAMAVMVLFDE